MRMPDNRFSLVLLFLMFLSGVAMVVIPMISQQQEISADDNLYAMLAQEIQAAAITTPEVTDISETAEADMPEEIIEEPAEATEPPSLESDKSETILAEEPLLNSEDEITILQPSAEPIEAVSTSIPTASVATPSTKPTSKPSAKPTTAPTSKPDTQAIQNEDYIAWLSIPGTVINYPVVRSDRTDYYLHHLITGQESKLGTLFSLTTSDYETPSRNIAIYGHHLSNSTAMFSTLMQYKSESYWKDHQTIQLDTIYGKRTYRIFAVLNHTVSDWDASTASFKNDEAFLKFVNRARKSAFYDTGITVSEGDHILTLITCDRSFGGVQGRLLVMGVEQ